ncbi:uncharacterized protein FIBRA_05726 [Fibroporia radiculosa]|uniref:Csf1 N-terminal domain-containing protein n=1 Tax=Fibroporia radiculosa TaxID=599839 RepID=J4H3P2_9APHY|nr:uncharacterized protein FIBRA_05726 [Fibroporia radiculosa]CCM03589.1 predicted protein [Fibroporia radiculosa]
MLNIVLLVTLICIIVALVLYLFFWNRFVAFLLGLVFRLAFWNQAESSIWVDIGSIHFSILTGRILFKDLRYHSSNQTIKVVKGMISWRYWIRRPAAEEDLSHAQVIGEDLSQKERLPLSCRVHMSLQGFEWFIYNRTAAYDNIVAQMGDDLPPTPAPTPAAPNLDARDALRKIFSKTSAAPDATTGPTISLVSSIYQKSPSFIKRAVNWIKLQAPNFDPKNLLPMGIEVTKGAIICGNASTPSLLVAQYSKAEGTYGIVQARSKFDLYKQLLNLNFRNASVYYVENSDYQETMRTVGVKIEEQIRESRSLPLRQSTYVSFDSFEKLWNRLELWAAAMPRSRLGKLGRYLRQFFGYPSVSVTHPSTPWSWRKMPKSLDDETPLGIDFSTLEYAIERKILEAPILEILYYADVVGVVPYEPLQPPTNSEGSDPFDIGNGDLPPEWGVDFVVRGGFLRYGPWADRQRVILQHCFFPPTFHDLEPAARLKPGDTRMWTGLKVFVELREGVTLHIPFREASKDWQWDGKVHVPNRPRRREAASIHIKAGDSSTISYILPMVVSPSGYQPILEVHLDTVTVTSSLNDIRLVSAESCRVRCHLPSPLQWNGERQWAFAVSLRQTDLYLLRDHMNMLTDLGKDWSSGPPVDYFRFIPMLYTVELDLHNYELNMYVNDHNIIDKPLIKEENGTFLFPYLSDYSDSLILALLKLCGTYLSINARLPSLRYRPEATTVSFGIEAPNAVISLTLPRWNSYTLYPVPDRTEIGRIGLVSLDASYRYHAEVRHENMDHLRLDFKARDVVFKAFGWTIRHFLILRDNYFGSFTHFSTLYEYLEKRKKGQPIGDPIELQYRLGKSNSMELELNLSVDGGFIILPIGLPGYEAHSPAQAKVGPADLGSCLVLSLPDLQVGLRTNDYYMDMSLNVGTLQGYLEDHWLTNVRSDRKSSQRNKDVIVIDSLGITANRLFGPQPQTSTYVCIWEIHVSNVKTALSTYQCQLLSALGTSFSLNYTDPLNAPAREFVVPTYPDVTFLKVTFDSVNVICLTEHSAVEIILPRGCRFDSNDLPGQCHRKVLSFRLPSATLKALVTTKQLSYTWCEVARIQFDAKLDIYVAPPGWQDSARAQTEFVTSQDKLTGRAKVLYSPQRLDPSNDKVPSGRGLLDNDLYLPQLRVSSRSHARRVGHSGIMDRLAKRKLMPLNEYLSASRQYESDGDEGVSEADRDARLANSRPIRSSHTDWYGEDESAFSGEESDDDDLTDSADSDWNSDDSCGIEDISPDGPWPSVLQYLDVTCHYKESTLRQPSLWDGSPFSLCRTPNPRVQRMTHMTSSSVHRRTSHYDIDLHAMREPADRNTHASVARFLCEDGVNIWLTPLVLLFVNEVVEDVKRNRLGPELRIDMLLAKYMSLSDTEGNDPPSQITVLDFLMSSVRVSLTQAITRSTSTKEGSRSRAREIPKTTTTLALEGCHVSAKFVQHSKGQTQGTFSSSIEDFSFSLKSYLGLKVPWTESGAAVPTCQISLGRSVFNLTEKKLTLSLGQLSTTVDHATPELTLATAVVTLQLYRAMINTKDKISSHIPALDKRLMHEILACSRQRTFIDPLSAIQPSYLVQKGLPDRLRKDNAFKLLVHLRNCLRYLDPSERQAIVNYQLETPPEITVQDIILLVDTQYLSHGLDEDAANPSGRSLLNKLFSNAATELAQDGQIHGQPPIDIVILQAGKLSVSIRHDAGGASCTESKLYLGPLASKIQFKSPAVLHLSPSNTKRTPPTLSLHDEEHPTIRHIILSISLDSLALDIYPRLISFFEVVVRMNRRYSSALAATDETASETKSPLNLPNRHKIPTAIGYFEAALSVKSLTFRAAADKLALEFSISGLGVAYTSLHKDALATEGRNSTNFSAILDETAFRVCATKECCRTVEQKTLASLIIRRSKISLVVLQEWQLISRLEIVLGVDQVELNVPRSVLRTYRFVEEWRADYLPGIETAFQTLVSELGSDKPGSPSFRISQRGATPYIQVHISLSSLRINLQIMLGTWLSWNVKRATAYLTSSVKFHQGRRCTFGLQMGPHLAEIVSRDETKSHEASDVRIQLELPVLALKGQYDESGFQGLVSVEFFHIMVKPSDWDIILSVQQKSGQDFNDLLHLIEQTSSKRSMGSVPGPGLAATNTMKISAFARMKGFQIGLEGHSSTVLLECNDISGSIENQLGLAWHIQLSDLALSLATRAGERVALERGHRSAFVTIDFLVKMRHQATTPRGQSLQFAITKVHAVMQPTSIGELDDFVDHLQGEVLLRQADRADELARFKEKTKSIMRSFDVKVGESQRPRFSWIDRYTISSTIKNIGVAFPLAASPSLRMNRSGGQDVAPAVRAFLFSIKSLSFGAQHGESGQATMHGFAFQFVPRFRQSIPTDFAGDSHNTRNRLLYPEMTANLRSERSSASRRIRIGADVSGFVLDMDSSIADYVFSLIDVYHQGVDRMDRLTSNISRPQVGDRESDTKSESRQIQPQFESLPTSNVLLSFKFASGRLRMHSGRYKHDSSRIRTPTSTHTFVAQAHGEIEAETFDLPVVSVWGEYRAMSAFRKLTGSYHESELSTLMFKSTIHSSQNTLRPTLLSFLTDLVTRIEDRMRQSSRPDSLSSPFRSHETLPSATASDITDSLDDAMSGTKISLSLRIDQSKLELTCQPDVNVIAGLHWDSGGFIVDIAPGARRVTFSGSVGGLTIGLKHGFLSEDCVRLDARNLAFNLTFAKTGPGREKISSSISVVVDTEFSGSIRFSRLQDVLCFKAVWLDRIPVFSSRNVAIPGTPNATKSTGQSIARSSHQELTTAVILRFRQIHLAADLGQSISLIHLNVDDMLVRTKICDAFSELTLTISQLAMVASGNVSGKISAPDFRFQSMRNFGGIPGCASGNKMLDLVITTGVFSIELESEFQRLIQYRAEPIEVKIYDDWSAISTQVSPEDRHVDVAFTVSGSDVVIIMNVGTIPKLVSYAHKFRMTLDNQREGAGRESKAFRVASSPKPDNPLSAVANAMLTSTRNRLKEEAGLTYTVGQRMSLRLNLLQLIVFPRSMRDLELAQFIGHDVHARLDRLVETNALPARRDLRLSFSSIMTSRISQLNHALVAKENADGIKQWLSNLVKDAPEAIIFGLPTMDIQMRSEETAQGGKRVLRYDFSSRFSVKKGTKDTEDIYISLNMSLYAWLTSLRKTFAREMEQVQLAGDIRGAANGFTQQTFQRKRGNDSISLRPETLDTVTASNGLGTSTNDDHVSLSSPVSPSKPAFNPSSTSKLMALPTSIGSDLPPPLPAKSLGLTYEPRERSIERLTMRQLGEATPDVMHPFFMKKAGFSLEDSLPQYVHEYATLPTEEIMKALLKIYSKQLDSNQDIKTDV